MLVTLLNVPWWLDFFLSLTSYFTTGRLTHFSGL